MAAQAQGRVGAALVSALCASGYARGRTLWATSTARCAHPRSAAPSGRPTPRGPSSTRCCAGPTSTARLSASSIRARARAGTCWARGGASPGPGSTGRTSTRSRPSRSARTWPPPGWPGAPRCTWATTGASGCPPSRGPRCSSAIPLRQAPPGRTRVEGVAARHRPPQEPGRERPGGAPRPLLPRHRRARTARGLRGLHHVLRVAGRELRETGAPTAPRRPRRGVAARARPRRAPLRGRGHDGRDHLLPDGRGTLVDAGEESRLGRRPGRA